MDHGHRRQRPTGFGVRDDTGDFFLRHPRIVLDLEAGEAPVLVAAVADERDDGADVGAGLGEIGGFRANVEILGLDADARHDQPPVIGGKKATSTAPAIFSVLRACRLSRAVRTTSGFSKAWA